MLTLTLFKVASTLDSGDDENQFFRKLIFKNTFKKAPLENNSNSYHASKAVNPKDKQYLTAHVRVAQTGSGPLQHSQEHDLNHNNISNNGSSREGTHVDDARRIAILKKNALRKQFQEHLATQREQMKSGGR